VAEKLKSNFKINIKDSFSNPKLNKDKLKKKPIKVIKNKENDIDELEEALKSNYDDMKNIVY